MQFQDLFQYIQNIASY